MHVQINAKTIGATAGTVAGGVTAIKYAGALTVLTIFYLGLDPATPPEVMEAWNDLFYGLYFVIVTAAIGAIGRLLSPGHRKPPAPPALLPDEPATTEGEQPNAKTS